MNYLYDFQRKDFEKGLEKIMENGLLFDYEYTEKFEKEFANQFGYKYAIAMPSGTTAITAVYKILNLYYNVKNVLIPALTVKEVWQGVRMSGCNVKFMDVSKELPVSGEKEIKEGIKNEKIDSICYVHTAGLSKIHEIDIPDDIILIEDCSHSHGIKELGKFGFGSIYSFWTTKVLGGGTGIITTNDKEFYEYIVNFVRHFKNKADEGYPFCVHEIPALMSYLDVKYWKKIVNKRQEQAKIYHENDIYSLQDKMPWKPTYYKFTVKERPPKNIEITGYTHKPVLKPLPNSIWWSENHWNLYIGRKIDEKILNNYKTLKEVKQ